MISDYITLLSIHNNEADKILDDEELTVEVFMDQIRQDTYDETQSKEFIAKSEGKKVQKKKLKSRTEEITPKQKRVVFSQKQNWSREQKWPAKQGSCNKCGERGNFARVSKVKQTSQGAAETRRPATTGINCAFPVF